MKIHPLAWCEVQLMTTQGGWVWQHQHSFWITTRSCVMFTCDHPSPSFSTTTFLRQYASLHVASAVNLVASSDHSIAAMSAKITAFIFNTASVPQKSKFLRLKRRLLLLNCFLTLKIYHKQSINLPMTAMMKLRLLVMRQWKISTTKYFWILSRRL